MDHLYPHHHPQLDTSLKDKNFIVFSDLFSEKVPMKASIESSKESSNNNSNQFSLEPSPNMGLFNNLHHFGDNQIDNFIFDFHPFDDLLEHLDLNTSAHEFHQFDAYPNSESENGTLNAMHENFQSGGSASDAVWNFLEEIFSQTAPQNQGYDPDHLVLNFQEFESSANGNRVFDRDVNSCISSTEAASTESEYQRKLHLKKRKRLEMPKASKFTKKPSTKGQWTAQEDKLLVQLVKKDGTKNWSEVAKLLHGRLGKQCRERWHNHLRPEIRKGTWSEDEDKILIAAHKERGNKWVEIAKKLPGRTENSVKNRWNATKRRQNSKKKRIDSNHSTKCSLLKYIKTITSSCTPSSSTKNLNHGKKKQVAFSEPNIVRPKSTSTDDDDYEDDDEDDHDHVIETLSNGFSFEEYMYSESLDFGSMLEEMASVGSHYAIKDHDNCRHANTNYAMYNQAEMIPFDREGVMQTGDDEQEMMTDNQDCEDNL